MDEAVPHHSRMHGMSAGRLVPTGSSIGKNVYEVSVPGVNWSLSELTPWQEHYGLEGQR